jgi:hypothetical protein
VIRMSVTAASLVVGIVDGVTVDVGVTGSVLAEGVRSVLAQAPPSKTASVGVLVELGDSDASCAGRT